MITPSWHLDIQHNDIQYNNTQHKDIQDIGLYCGTQHKRHSAKRHSS